MAKFKLNDRARFVKTYLNNHHLIGKVCVVRAFNPPRTQEGYLRDYLIEFEDGTPPPVNSLGWAVNGDQLEPLIDQLGSWKEIERVIGWSPFKQLTEVN